MSNKSAEKEEKLRGATARSLLVLVNEMQELRRHTTRVEMVVNALAERHGVDIPAPLPLDA